MSNSRPGPVRLCDTSKSPMPRVGIPVPLMRSSMASSIARQSSDSDVCRSGLRTNEARIPIPPSATTHRKRGPPAHRRTGSCSRVRPGTQHVRQRSRPTPRKRRPRSLAGSPRQGDAPAGPLSLRSRCDRHLSLTLPLESERPSDLAVPAQCRGHRPTHRAPSAGRRGRWPSGSSRRPCARARAPRRTFLAAPRVGSRSRTTRPLAAGRTRRPGGRSRSR